MTNPNQIHKNMKKFICLISLLMLTATLSFAQETQNHLKFQGVPIDGSLRAFVEEMKQMGFESKSYKDDICVMEGDFAGYKKCILSVNTQKQKDVVNIVMVIFPSCETWQALSNNYFSLKKKLTKKYGKPTEVDEKWDSDTKPKDDNSKMQNAKSGRCNYSSWFDTNEGCIHLFIEHYDELSKCFVTLSYFDIINREE